MKEGIKQFNEDMILSLQFFDSWMEEDTPIYFSVKKGNSNIQLKNVVYLYIIYRHIIYIYYF